MLQGTVIMGDATDELVIEEVGECDAPPPARHEWPKVIENIPEEALAR